MTRVLRKDNEIAMNWLDYFWYIVAVYISIPMAFNQLGVSSDSSNAYTILFVKRHIIVSIALVLIGFFLTAVKLNRGFVKY